MLKRISCELSSRHCSALSGVHRLGDGVGWPNRIIAALALHAISTSTSESFSCGRAGVNSAAKLGDDESASSTTSQLRG